MRDGSEVWPSLPLDAWRDTYTTLHMWTQVVGKIRLALAPPENHWWHVALYLTARGLTTSPMPHGARAFQIDFDFVSHELVVQASDGSVGRFGLDAFSVAEFHARLMRTLDGMGLPVHIWTHPVEVVESIPFERDHLHASYDPDYASRHWRILVRTDHVMRVFRSAFLGKASPVHFFWGGFDLAMTLFSGRTAPPHPGGAPNVGDWVMREGYSHECASMGFWPGGGAVEEAAFYAYTYPEPEGYKERPIAPEPAFYHPELRELILPYDVVRRSAEPDDVLLSFFRSGYDAAADSARWNRAALEREPLPAKPDPPATPRPAREEIRAPES